MAATLESWLSKRLSKKRSLLKYTTVNDETWNVSDGFNFASIFIIHYSWIYL
jgi:hypothetical protein